MSTEDSPADSITPLTTTAILAAAGGKITSNAGENTSLGLKRVFAQVGEEKQKKRKNKKAKITSGPVPVKNALMQLNEVKPGLVYNIGPQEGPTHNPLFRCTVEVNGQLFEGQGVSKKKAKLDVAEKALASFVQLPNAAQAAKALKTEDGDYTTDKGEGSGFSNFDGNKAANGGSEPSTQVMAHVGIPLSKPPQPLGKNPVMILNEIRPGTQYEFISESGDHLLKCFTMQVKLDGKEFNGEGRSKKQAKARAAQAALKELFNLEFTNPPEDGIPYFEGNDEEWIQHKQSFYTTREGYTIESEGKNPVQKLNELYQDIIYEVHEPEGAFRSANIFRVNVHVEGEEYEGMANSKKMAKLAAARSALEGLAQSGLLAMKEQQIKNLKLTRERKQQEILQRMQQKKQEAGGGPLFPRKRQPVDGGVLSSGQTNPVSRLNERTQLSSLSSQYKVVGEMRQGNMVTFTVQCIVDGIVYLGAGKSKKQAKYNAAEKALRAKSFWTDADEQNKISREKGEPETAVDPPEVIAKLRPVLGKGASRGRGGNRGGIGYHGRGSGSGRGRGGGSFGSRGRGGAGSSGQNTYSWPGGKSNSGYQPPDSKFRSVLGQKWTDFKKGSELSSGMVFGQKGGISMGGATNDTTNTSSSSAVNPQKKSQYQDFSSDSYSYDSSQQYSTSQNTYVTSTPQTVPSQNYGYGYDTSQAYGYGTGAAYASGYPTGYYGYGDAYNNGSSYSQGQGY